MLSADPQIVLRILNGDVPEEVRVVNFQGQQYPLLLVTHLGRLGYRDLGDDTYQIVVETTEDATSISMDRPNPLSERNEIGPNSMMNGRQRYNDPRYISSWKGMGSGNRATIFSRTTLQQQHVAHISQLKFRLMALLGMVKCPCGDAWVNPDAPEALRQLVAELGVRHRDVIDMPEWLRVMVRVMVTRKQEAMGLMGELNTLLMKIDGLTAASKEFGAQRLQLQRALTGNSHLGAAVLEPIRSSLEGLGPEQESVEGALIRVRAEQAAHTAYLKRAANDEEAIASAMMLVSLAAQLLDGTGLVLGIAAEETDRHPLELEDAQTRTLSAGTDAKGPMQGSAASHEKLD